MEDIRRLISRFRQTGLWLLVGFILILYISLGFAYWQQKNQQTNLEKQIAQQSLVLSKPLPSAEKLKADYDNVTGNNSPLASITDEYAAFTRLVGIAEKSGINVEETGKLSIPSPGISTVTVGGSTFQLISFRGIRVQGDNSSVKAFLTDLDSGKTLETMVLRRMAISYIEISFIDKAKVDAATTELNSIRSAILSMMKDLGLSSLNITRVAGNATANMSEFPNAAYHLYGMTVNGTAVNYSTANMTRGTYSVDASGKVTQVTTGYPAVEFRTETIASIDVDIYTTRFEKK